MQSAREAVEELRYAAEVLGIRMVEIGTHINGVNLDDEAFRPFFECAADLGVLVQLHPHRVGGPRATRPLLHEQPGGQSHGHGHRRGIADPWRRAGTLPVPQRLSGARRRRPSLSPGARDHGHGAVDAGPHGPRQPGDLLPRFYFDTILHDPRMLAFLRDLAGEERLLLGTDYPYDMGESDPLGLLEQAGLGGSDAVCGKTPPSCWAWGPTPKASRGPVGFEFGAPSTSLRWRFATLRTNGLEKPTRSS